MGLMSLVAFQDRATPARRVDLTWTGTDGHGQIRTNRKPLHAERISRDAHPFDVGFPGTPACGVVFQPGFLDSPNVCRTLRPCVRGGLPAGLPRFPQTCRNLATLYTGRLSVRAERIQIWTRRIQGWAERIQGRTGRNPGRASAGPSLHPGSPGVDGGSFHSFPARFSAASRTGFSQPNPIPPTPPGSLFRAEVEVPPN